MKIKTIALLMLFAISSSCVKTHKKSDTMERVPEIYIKTINNLIGFFDKHAYDPQKLVYYSEIDNEGNRKSDKIFTVALNRVIYGLSYTSKLYPDNLIKAQNAATFLLNHLIGKDSIGGYFISYIKNDSLDTSKELDIWQQAYGLCGLTELYRNKPDKELLSKIHELHNAFVERFRDKVNGGFYGNYTIGVGQKSGSKSLQALMYPITAYMANLWLADILNRDKYELIIKENLKIICQSAWNSQTNWVNIKFDDSWNVCKSENSKNPCFIVSPGHNFQLASLLLRTKSWSFISETEKAVYIKTGFEIIEATLKKDIYAKNNIGNGFYSQVNPLTNEILDTRKTWWQHCEAIIALSLCEGKHAEELKQLKQFFFNTFPDFKNGGEFFYTDKDNKPVTNELKGGIGKAAYHTIEMIRFLLENK